MSAGYLFGRRSCHCVTIPCEGCADALCCRHMTVTLTDAGLCDRTDTFEFPMDALTNLLSAVCGPYGPEGEDGWLIAYDICDGSLCGLNGYWEAFIPLIDDGAGHCCPEVGAINWVCVREGGCGGMTLTGEVFAGPLDWENTDCDYCEYCSSLSEEELETDSECTEFVAAKAVCLEHPCQEGCPDMRYLVGCEGIPECTPCEFCREFPGDPFCDGFAALLAECETDPCSEACNDLFFGWGCDDLPPCVP